jgi:DNA mismatch endonuclease (patch repair protein)
MSRILCRDTKIERTLGHAMWVLGLRYRKNYERLEGRPDFVFVSARVAVFCDSSFWHGRGWGPRRRAEFKVRTRFWIAKIERNIERDQEVNRILRRQGWRILRFWDDAIKASPDRCARIVQKTVAKRSPLG